MEDSKSTSGGVGIGIPSTSHWPETLQRAKHGGEGSKLFPADTRRNDDVIMTIKTTSRRRCDGHNDAIIASCVRWDSFCLGLRYHSPRFCPIWTKNRDGSKCDILFDFPWHIVVETMHLFRDLKKMRGENCRAYLIYPTYISGIPSREV